ncbi:FAD/NAD(P)-binding oxidoreductase [Chitinophaga sp. XS-30]|uniref:NAD(P)/FAD-dependent oxidoreductase n=1 Tax=Chitinophaga sp. XS-30 TaxID=2604421 RepID=UPI0011DD80BE|nr:FAD/NAD(P)-binding oxidoreductase [Chitinophaga sp. XS-30]QEH41456.1 NAD(P)/FAD-dependent oxidoreductase [Chitinophaga sp. XS-30]
MPVQHKIIIVGGGNAGLSVAARLLRKDSKLDVAVIEPSDKHYYQPAWTLVGSGIFDIRKTMRREGDVMPAGAQWIKDKVAAFLPEEHAIVFASGEKMYYEYLVVAPGIQLNWNDVKGLKESLGTNGVCSNYSYDTAPYTFESIRNFKGGRAIFHNPHTPVKCGGAPHKIMYMAADYFRRHGLLKKADIQYWSGGTRLFGVPEYEKTLLEVCRRADIHLHFQQQLVEIDGPGKRAKFTGMGEHQNEETWVDFDMIHVTPPQSAPDFVKQSPLANAAGWVDVDRFTLQHVKYPDIFSLGDAASLPTSKTGAAIRKQAPVLVENLLRHMRHQPLSARYNGYTSCPVVTGYGKLVLAEFDYDNHRVETFPFDQSRERWSMFLLKRYVLPWMYWARILTGKA